MLGREVADPAELTAAEAAAVLDELLGPPSDEPPTDEQQPLDVEDSPEDRS